jgi:hypothetical protein
LKIDQFDLHSQGLDGLVTVGVGGVVVGVVLGKVTFGWVAVEVAAVVAVETLAFGLVQVVVESVTFGVVYVMGEEEEAEKKKMVELLSPFYQHLVLDLYHPKMESQPQQWE